MLSKRTGLFCALIMSFVATSLVTLSFISLSSTPAEAYQRCGKASWYAGPTNRTANGERLNHGANTAAHKTLPFGSKVRVTNKRNGRSIIVRINDRGPFIRGRIIDLTRGGASRLGFINSGVTPVCITRIK